MDATAYFCQKLKTSADDLKTYMQQSLNGVDGELFLQHSVAHGISLADGKVQSPYSTMDEGFGLRRVVGDKYFFSNGALDFSSIQTQGQNLAEAQRLSGTETGGLILPRASFENPSLYSADDIVTNRAMFGFDDAKIVEILYAIDAYVREKSDKVTNVQAGVDMAYSKVLMVLATGELVEDYRPMANLRVSVTMMDGDRVERNADSKSGRYSLNDVLSEQVWKDMADEAYNGAATLLTAQDCPTGELDVLLDAGAAGVLVHEAIGHPFEGDSVWQKRSCFSVDDLGKQVASKGVKLVDSGVIQNWRGSINVDDEGCRTQETVLLEDGVLKNFIHDRVSAAKLGVKPTGNGRRQSYAHAPMTRMTNTYIAGGDAKRADIIASVKKGILACGFNGGMVDTTKGSFNFGMTLGYYIENGEIKHPVKMAELKGDCRSALMNIKAVGDDFELSDGMWGCSKQGQNMAVSVGEPTVLIGGLTVGGGQ